MNTPAGLSEAFAALLGGDAPPQEPGALVGLEQEYTVRDSRGWPVDFGALLPVLPVDGGRFDPVDRNARRCASGVVLTSDGREAEIAAPPVTVRPGFTHAVGGWSRTGRGELLSSMPDTLHPDGYSTHLSVALDSIKARRDVALCGLYTRTFAPGLMLLLDRAMSPGLLVRPRPGRTELCGEFVEGVWLRAASAYAVGSVLACRDAVRGERSLATLPPQLRVELEPAVARAGWYVDRSAFGVDLLARGRAAPLRRCDGRGMRAQDHLEVAWAVAREVLSGRSGPSDLAAADALVSRALPLPSEASRDFDPDDGGTAAPSSAFGGLLARRVRKGFGVEPEVVTWDLAVFRVDAPSRRAYAVVPRARLTNFLQCLDGGALDDVLTGYLATPPSGRVVPASAETQRPALGDVLAPVGQLARDELVSLDTQVSGFVARALKDALTTAPPVTAFQPTFDEPAHGTKVWTRVGLGLGGLALLGGLGYTVFGGDDGNGTAPPAVTPPVGVGGCGEGEGNGAFAFDDLLVRCDYTPAQRKPGAMVYPEFTSGAKDAKVTIASGPAGPPEPVFGDPCPVHDATDEELAEATDPLTGFVGLSFVGFPVAGLPDGAVVEAQLLSPDTRTLTGRDVVDGGYAEPRVPIDMPVPHTLMAVRFWADGDVSGAPIEVNPLTVVQGLAIDASFPGFRCDPDSALSLVPDAPTPDAALADAASDAAVDTISLNPLLGTLLHPGRGFDLTGAFSVLGDEDGLIHIDGPLGVGVTWQPVMRAGGDEPGDTPSSIYFRGAFTLEPTPDGTANALDAVLPCGAGQLALTICADTAEPLTDGAYALVVAVFEPPVPLEPPDNARYEFLLDDKPYVATFAPDDGWSLSGDDARARILVRNNVMVLLVPNDEPDLTYRISTDAGGRTDTQPPADEPVAASFASYPVEAPPEGVDLGGGSTTSSSVAPSSTTTTTTVPQEKPREFIDALVSALADGDADFLVDRMHPVVIERFGTEACRAYADGAQVALEFRVQSVSDPEPYAWETDGLTRVVPRTRSVGVEEVRDGATTPRTIHIAFVDGKWRWFTDCGTPLAGAP